MKKSTGVKPVGPKTDHHFLPKLYLRGFSEQSAGSHVWVYTRGRPFIPGPKQSVKYNPYRQAIKSAGARKDQYALTTLKGKVDHEHYENILAEQEELAKPALMRIRACQPITQEDKSLFAFYVELLMRRVPKYSERVAMPLLKQTMKDYPWDLLARKAAEEGRFTEALKFSRDKAETQKLLERETLLNSIVSRSRAIIQQIATMSWRLYCIDNDRFFPTTDNPVLFPLNGGIARLQGFVLFPISSQILLFALNLKEQDQLYVPPSPDQYEVFRRVILQSTAEHAYAHCADQGVVDMLQEVWKPGTPP